MAPVQTANPACTFSVTEEGDTFAFRIASDMKAVDALMRKVEAFVERLGAQASSRFTLVVRELLINAVEHGNKNDARKAVAGSIAAADEARFRVTVRDEGEGFDPSKVDMSPPIDPTQPRQRGYPLIRAFTESLEFADGGRCVTVVLQNSDGPLFKGEEDGDVFVVRPAGSLTAATAEKFRSYLNEAVVARGRCKVRFDLSLVDAVDSKGLCVFVVLPKLLAKLGREVVLEIAGSRKDVANLFRMTRLDTVYSLT